MQRFDIGDPIVILPRFAHLYPIYWGTVTDLRSDPFRPMFTEYTIQFPDGSTTNVFEFQILEAEPNCETFLAALVLDSHQQPAMAGHRGQTPDRRIILQTQTIDIDMKIQASQHEASIIGQILERETTNFVSKAVVTLMRDNIPITSTTTDNAGTFKFAAIDRGALNIQVVIRANSPRILGAFPT
jgi:hypothetical protein